MGGTHIDATASRPPGLVSGGHRAENMRRGNASAILRAILAHGPVSRAEIARQTGLSAPSVTKLTGSLIAAGLVHDLAPQAPTDLGRPRIPVRIDAGGPVVLGLHFGLRRTTFGLVGLDGRVHARTALTHTGRTPRELVDQAAAGAAAFLARHAADRRLLGSSASIGGWVDSTEGVVVAHRPLAWTDVPLRAMLADRLPGPFRLEQHTRATAQAELWYGAGREADDLVLVFVGNVVDAAVVIDRVIHRGPNSAAGRIAHLRVDAVSHVRCACGRTGCLEQVASDVAVLAAAADAGLAADDLDALIALADAGDETADGLLRTRARLVGRAVGTVIDVVNPERVVLAGSMVTEDAYLNVLRAEAESMVYQGRGVGSRVQVTTLGVGALVVSAAAPLLADVLRDPFAYVEEVA
ncbi:hypothetical protein B4N89_40590 [Embleya scabrispora]|uniref:HTH marR-type domain-containing protein n=1 Tax=Embleya scabrispora TaxID=159449 RepID=A0A1T3NJL5_9ACTN|nr:ROK family transcriptional regulator [Embleya scabrispora]OPC76905.1 hypothetical protein B4N89_40590 [Embleya scabrispora]